MRKLLLSAYDTLSHRLWRERLAGLFPDDDWCQLSLPARHFEWRLRSNSLHWGLQDYPELEAHWDLLIATSMVDLAALRGLRPNLAQIPTLLYFHENQFFYPTNPERNNKRTLNVEPMLIPVYSALCADQIVFNSAFNKRTFLHGARELFQKLPDNLPDSAWHKLEAASTVPVPVEYTGTQKASDRPARDSKVLQVLWNHRWEYDKGPEILLAVVEQLLQLRAPIQIHVAGQQFRQQPEQFATITELCVALSELHNLPRPVTGYIESKEEYGQLLSETDVVLSTAWHEFQGLGMQEACLAGACPLAPDDLVYPEYLPAECLYQRGANTGETAHRIVERLLQWQRQRAQDKALPCVPLDSFCGDAIRSRYQQLFTALQTKHPG